MPARLAIAALIVALSGCKSPPSRDGPCDAPAMANLRKVLAKLKPSDRALITTVGMGEACEVIFPSEIQRAIKALATFSMADRATLIVSALKESPTFAKAGCADFENALQAALKTEPGDRSAALYAGCHYERFELLS